MYYNITYRDQYHINWYKRLTSKKLFIGIVFTYSVLVWAYCTTWTILYTVGIIPLSILAYVRDDVVLALDLILIGCMLLAFGYDLMWTNRKILFVKCSWWEYFTIHDPLRFRIESGLLVIAWIFVYLANYFLYFGTSSTNPFGLGAGASCLYFIGSILYILAFGGLACIYSIIFMIRDKHKNKMLSVGGLETLTGEQKLYKVLLDVPDGFNLVRNFHVKLTPFRYPCIVRENYHLKICEHG
jgi:hypothetical protein